MPSLAEEDPEYQAKVAAYLADHKMPALPWGFILARGNLVAVSTTAERRDHAAGIVEVPPTPDLAYDVPTEQVVDAEVAYRDLDKNIEESI